MSTELSRAIDAWLDAQTDDFRHCEGCEYDCRCETCPAMTDALRVVAELHKPHSHPSGLGPYCNACEGGYEGRSPWPCATASAIARALGVEVAE